MFTLEQIGLTQETLQEKVVDALVDRFLGLKSDFDYGDDNYHFKEKILDEVQKRFEKVMRDAVAAIAEKHVIPNVTSYLESMVIQRTNKYGEKTGEKYTFVEFLVKTAQDYMKEQVNKEGKPQPDRDTDRYYHDQWRADQPRLQWLLAKHIADTLDAAIKLIVTDANKVVCAGLEETLKLKMAEIASNFRLATKVEEVKPRP